MIRKIVILAFAIAISYGANAQGDISDVLNRVELLNKDLQANRDLTDAQKIEARTALLPSNPSVSYDNLWGGPRNGHRAMGELTIAQPLDFPTAYFSRSSIAKMKGSLYDSQIAFYRQQILLQAKQICIEIIFLRNENALLTERLNDANKLKESYKVKLHSGSANILEMNKIELEALTVTTQLKLNTAALKTQQEKLVTMLGGEECNFTQMSFPKEESLPSLKTIESIYMSDDPLIKGLEKSVDISNKSISLEKALSLPQLEVGYRHNFGAEGRFSGFTVGMSLPIFESQNRVKTAKAQSVAVASQLRSTQLDNLSTLRQLYGEAVSYSDAIRNLQVLLNGQNNVHLLEKALNEGQISVIEYFTELKTIYDSRDLILQMERSYSQTIAKLYRYKL